MMDAENQTEGCQSTWTQYWPTSALMQGWTCHCACRGNESGGSHFWPGWSVKSDSEALYMVHGLGIACKVVLFSSCPLTTSRANPSAPFPVRGLVFRILDEQSRDAGTRTRKRLPGWRRANYRTW